MHKYQALMHSHHCRCYNNQYLLQWPIRPYYIIIHNITEHKA